MPEGSDLDRRLKYEGSIERQFHRAIEQLQRFQETRAGAHIPAPVNTDLAVPTENTN